MILTLNENSIWNIALATAAVAGLTAASKYHVSQDKEQSNEEQN